MGWGSEDTTGDARRYESRARADEPRRTEPEQANQGLAERDATEERRGKSQKSRYEDDRIRIKSSVELDPDEGQREGQQERTVQPEPAGIGPGKERAIEDASEATGSGPT